MSLLSVLPALGLPEYSNAAGTQACTTALPSLAAQQEHGKVLPGGGNTWLSSSEAS